MLQGLVFGVEVNLRGPPEPPVSNPSDPPVPAPSHLRCWDAQAEPGAGGPCTYWAAGFVVLSSARL